ncbi:HNH endonuclease [Celeribacter sp.]|uniref:HNH endonuclease n=1 Tax=Celeribacter sp. TaxID=1890673 RepID=UPI003A915768
MTNRIFLTDAQRRGVLFDQKGLCADCGRTINLAKGDAFEIDHEIPVALGGSNQWRNAETRNMRALCVPCHRAKTTRDIKAISKAKRVAAKFRGEHPPARHQIPGSKRTRFIKKLDGTVIDRSSGNTISTQRKRN